MAKHLIVLVLILTLALAACAQGSQVDATPVASPESGSTVGQATEKTPTSEPKPTREPGCTVNSPRPTPGPTAQAILPPPGEDDWTKGATDGYITLIEYSDFQ